MSVSDNVVANPGSGGSIFRTFSDGTDQWPASVLAWVTGGSAGSWTFQEVTSTNGLPVAVLGTVAATQSGSWSVSLAAALPAGSNIIGAVTQNGSWSVGLTGVLPAGTNTIGGVELVDSGGVNKASISSGGAIKVDGSAVTQPISGSVTVTDSVPLAVVLTAAPAVIGGEFKLIDSGGTNVATVTAGNALKVDGSAVTQPISGTITANAGTGTFTVSGTITADQGGTWTVSTNADGSVTGGAVASKSLLIGAQYNSSAPTLTTGEQVSLQTDVHGNLLVNIASGGGSGGTSSSFSSAFPATGTAAGASDGTNMKPLLVDGSGFLKVNVAAGGGSGGTSSTFGAVFPGTGTAVGASDGTDMRALEVDGSGNLKVNVVAGGGGGSNAAASATGAAVPTDADYTGLKVGANLQGQTGVSLSAGTIIASNTDLSSVGGTAVALGQAVMASSIPVVLASNQSAIPASQSGSWTVTANAGSGTFTVSGTVTANAGTGSFTVAQATAANLNATVTGTVISNIGTTNGLALDATLTGGSQKTIPVAGTSGGATPYHLVSAATTNATSVKASAGTVYGVQCFNTNASPRYLKFFDKASAPTLGTDTPVKTIMMPGNASGAGATMPFPVGVKFSTGIAFAITGAIADNDNTAIGANDCVVNFDYQ